MVIYNFNALSRLKICVIVGNKISNLGMGKVCQGCPTLSYIEILSCLSDIVHSEYSCQLCLLPTHVTNFMYIYTKLWDIQLWSLTSEISYTHWKKRRKIMHANDSHTLQINRHLHFRFNVSNGIDGDVLPEKEESKSWKDGTQWSCLKKLVFSKRVEKPLDDDESKGFRK